MHWLPSTCALHQGWKVLVDGQETETFKISGAMTGVSVKPGEHTVEFVYSPQGLKLGIVISAATVAGICGYVIVRKKRKKQLTQQK